MEATTQENNNPSQESAADRPGKKKADDAPAPPSPKAVVPEAPKINPTTFPVITSRILLKTDVPPAAALKLNQLDFEQHLCFLCLETPDRKKLVFHMYLSNEKELEKDSARMRKMYENKKDLRIVDRLVCDTICARSLCHRVQNKLTDVTWNKQKSIFEIDRIGERDVWRISDSIYKLQYEEMAKLFNYIKFLSATNS